MQNILGTESVGIDRTYDAAARNTVRGLSREKERKRETISYNVYVEWGREINEMQQFMPTILNDLLTLTLTHTLTHTQ